MLRKCSPLLIGLSLIASFACLLHADPPVNEQDRKLSTLAVQQAMAVSRQHLRESQPKKAVDILEEQLPRAGGHQGFLELLRDSYRDYIRKLSLDNDVALTQRYLQRLKILDPQAASALTVSADEKPVKFEARPAPKTPSQPLPNFVASHPTKQGAAKGPPVAATNTNGAKPSAVRGKIDEPRDDPFDPSNQRLPSELDAKQLASQLLARADEEFGRRRYKEARMYYEQAWQADQNTSAPCRESWAYCMLNDVVESLNRPAMGGKAIPDLQKEVHGALAIAPKLAPTAQWLLREIDQRQKTSTSAAPSQGQDAPVSLQHFGRNPQGWQVTETPNFRIFHNQSRDLVERVAQAAERTRLEMSRKWFGNDGADWQGKCELVLHATAQEYSRQTGVPTTSPGHSRIESDRGTNRVIGRRMDLHVDNVSMVEAVLPHETTHIVIAGQFGPHQVPRWVDEGMAVLAEPDEKVSQHRRNLTKAAADGRLFGVKELLELENYPPAQRISAFYAQSVGLVDFLAQQHGPTVFTQFVTDALRSGWDGALSKHYGWTLGELQQHWDAHVQTDAQRVAATGR